MSILKDIYKPYLGICISCYPSHFYEMMAAGGFHKKDGTWIGGYSKAKGEKYLEFKKEFEKNRLSKVIDIDPEHGVACCKKHLMEIVALFDEENVLTAEQEREQAWKNILEKEENKNKEEHLRTEIKKDIQTLHNIINKK